MRTSRRNATVGVLLILGAVPAGAQQPARQKLASVEQAVAASGQLAGSAGPRSVNWIDDGQRFAYTIANPATRRDEIRRYDPATLKDELLLDTRELRLPASEQPLAYRSFQWARDARTLLSSRPTSDHSSGTRPGRLLPVFVPDNAAAGGA
jgi:dipeptidyl-peptidase-4